MKKQTIIAAMLIWVTMAPIKQSFAQDPITAIIKAGVVKVIKAIDLKIQRLQNRTIWLQNAQKTLENEMAKLKLKEIGDWANHQKELYAKYFDELSTIKAIITTYQVVKDIISNQRLIVREYSNAIHLAKQDKNFTLQDIGFMEKVYAGIINESLRNIEQLRLVVSAFKTEMTDGKRLAIISQVAGNIETNLSDVRQFNQQTILVSLQRAKDKNDVDVVRQLYGIRK